MKPWGTVRIHNKTCNTNFETQKALVSSRGLVRAMCALDSQHFVEHGPLEHDYDDTRRVRRDALAHGWKEHIQLEHMDV